MNRLLKGLLLAVAVDFYFFPVPFTFIPHGINSKMIIAAFGAVAFLFNCIKEKSVNLSRRTLISGLLAIIFSLWCYYSVTENGTNDMTYATYWTSFATWMGGAYGVYVLLKALEERATLATITKYLVIVCVAQCIIALMIDNIPAFDRFLSRIFFQATDYFKRNGRLYGIGCALDPAGVRFAAVLLLTAHQITFGDDVGRNKATLAKYLTGFIIIIIVGSIIARTTTTGALLALVYIIFSNAAIKRGGYITSRQVWFYALLIILVLAFVLAGINLYNSNPEVRSYLRFGFEGFFNWVETGEFRTNSTDILMNVMWVWPDNFHDWMIGTGRYGLFVWNTDIGYCNFVLYCGLIGLVLFASYFIYSILSLNGKYKNFYLISLLLITLQAIIWAKVATDIFLLIALLLCMDGDIVKQEEQSA